MPNCHISLLVDKITEQNLISNRSLINEYIDEKKIIPLDEHMTPMQRSRWIKTSMRDLVKGDFLYVDVDTIFAAPIKETLFTDDVMGVPDGNYPLNIHPMKWSIESNLKKAGFNNVLDYYINSGVLFFKDNTTAHNFSKLWHKRWNESCKRGILFDQPALHQAIIDSGNVLKLLPNYANAQFGRNMNTFANGVILHYYSSWTGNKNYVPAYKFLQNGFLKEFRKKPQSNHFQELIRNPKEAFDESTLIMGSKDDHNWNSKLIQQLMAIQSSSNRADKRLYSLLDFFICSFCNFYYKTIKILHPFFSKNTSNIP